MAIGAAAAPVGLGEAAGEQVVGQLKLARDAMPALAEEGSLGTFGIDPHLQATKLAEQPQSKPRARNRE